jgi:hypothetical protein
MLDTILSAVFFGLLVVIINHFLNKYYNKKARNR